MKRLDGGGWCVRGKRICVELTSLSPNLFNIINRIWYIQFNQIDGCVFLSCILLKPVVQLRYKTSMITIGVRNLWMWSLNEECVPTIRDGKAKAARRGGAGHKAVNPHLQQRPITSLLHNTVPKTITKL